LSLPDSTIPPTPPEAESAIPPAPEAAPNRLNLRTLAREVLETVLLTVIIYAAVNFATGRFRVEGTSMHPNFQPGEYVLVDKLSYRIGKPQRGDVIVFEYPLAVDRDFIKRVIGLPGETVSIHDGKVLINEQPLTEPYIAAAPNYTGAWTLGPDEYFVMGDNRNGSSDSHSWGPLKRQYLIGRAVAVYWPSTAWRLMPHYAYDNVVSAAPGSTSAPMLPPPLPSTVIPPPPTVIPSPYPPGWSSPSPMPTITSSYP
jgi:signal peptidase I